MNLEVLHIDDCPNWRTASERLRAAVLATGRSDASISLRLLRTEADIAGTAFHGSPTITLDGEDLFSAEAGTTDLACRIYRTPEGLAGSPTVEQLVERIRAHGR